MVLNKNKGFTLIELLVVISIIVIILIISFLSFTRNKEIISLQSDSENLLLNIRKSQSLAMAVNNAGSGNYQNGYGVYFNLDHNNGVYLQDTDPFSYILFTDFENTLGSKNWDRAYLENHTNVNCGNPVGLISECVQKIKTNDNNYILSLELCDTYCSSTDILTITFLRPNLDAYFCTTPTSLGGCNTPISAGYAKITLKSPQTGKSKVIYVWSTGQISIE